MKVAIVGGGAAGLMAAASLLETDLDCDIFLIEKNSSLGKKVIISGGGRCNVTTGIQDLRIVLTKYPRGGKFLSSAMHRFPPSAVYRWFEDRGVPLKIERDLRVFPASDQGRDIVAVFERLFQRGNVKILLNHHVQNIRKLPPGFDIVFKQDQRSLQVDAVVITTGGQAYRQTGSTGDGYALAQALGHGLTPLAPSLNAFFCQETWPGELAGLSFDDVGLSVKRSRTFSARGPILFTHKGISGPAVFALSSLVAFEHYAVTAPLALSLDLFPEQTAEELVRRLETQRQRHPNQSCANLLNRLLPKSVGTLACRTWSIASDQTAGALNKKQLRAIAAWTKQAPLTVIGRGAGDEFVTAGGIPLTEVQPSTMESRLCPGLYFAGEILDIDGYTGGFNLQASWATGHLAGQAIAQRNAPKSKTSST